MSTLATGPRLSAMLAVRAARRLEETARGAAECVEDGNLADAVILAEEVAQRTEELRSAIARARKADGDGLVVQHLDGNPYNNDPENLRVVDPRENRQ